MISVNDIIQDTYTNINYRVLWLSENGETAFAINLDADDFPIQMMTADVSVRLRDGSMTVIHDDPYARLIPETEISEKNRAFRDNLWDNLKELFSLDKEPDVFVRKSRGRLVDAASEETGISKVTIYRQLKRYWKRGKNKNALLPDSAKKGGKGVKKKSGKKLGRPRKYGKEAGKFIDEQTEKIFEAAIGEYYHTRMEHTFKSAYEAMVREHFSKEIIGKDGKKRLELLPATEIPTIDQFRYWYAKRYSQEDSLRARKGAGTYDLEYRAVTGKSDTGLMGPGAKYQIDATVGDIYLVSQFNRADIIGRPILYFVIDAFSRMVTGMYVGLEGPSWTGAMMALANAASDKVKFCAEYGIEIAEADWPCRHIPDAILGDRGEMEGKSVETLINSLGVRIENAPPYRADMKGIVEQYFHMVNTTVTAFLPGHVKPDMSHRGGHDYRLDAKLDLRQFTKIIIECVLYHNNDHLLESFERDGDMIRDNIQPIPIKLWEWGIKNRSGLLRSFPENIVKLCLLPAAKASVTARGIRFKGIYYLCDLAIREGWFEKSRAKGGFRVDISYDPRDMARIYLRNAGDSPYEVCYLADWQEKYNGKYLDEIIYLQESEKQDKQGYSAKKLEDRVNLSARVEEIVAEAVEQAKQTPLLKSKTQRTGNIRANRGAEKENLRREEAFRLSDDDALIEGQPDSAPADNDEDLLYLDLIRKNAEERKHD